MTLHASLVDDIINFENGDMNDETTIEFFQKLIDGGMAWTLQGSYGRMATRMIEAGVCHRKGEGQSDALAERRPGDTKSVQGWGSKEEAQVAADSLNEHNEAVKLLRTAWQRYDTAVHGGRPGSGLAWSRVNKAFHARHRRGQGAFVTARTPGPWSLVAAQEQAIRQMMEPRTSDGRQRKHQWSVLKHYRAEASKQGFTDDMIKQHIRDIRDMCALESEAE